MCFKKVQRFTKLLYASVKTTCVDFQLRDTVLMCPSGVVNPTLQKQLVWLFGTTDAMYLFQTTANGMVL